MKIIYFVVCSAITCCLYSQEKSENTLSDVEKIFGLSKCWSEVKYNFVYFDKLTFDWDSLYQATIPIVLATDNDFLYYRELQRFIEKLKDGHTSVWWRQDLWDNWAPAPFMTRLIDGKMIVTKLLNDELEQNYGIKRGLEIVRINGIDVHEYVSTNIKPYIASSTEQSLNFMAYGNDATRGKKTESILLTFKDENNRVFESEISRSMPSKALPQTPLFDFRVLEDNIGILKIADFWRDNFTVLFDSIYEKIVDTDALIIDIRDNNGGNSNNAVHILSHLTNNKFKMATWSSPRYIPAFASWNRPSGWYIDNSSSISPKSNKTIYQNPIVLLIDENTCSAAEDFCVGYRNMERGLIIGTPSCGSTGNPIVFSLPGGGGIRICTKKDTYPDGTEFVGVGILPDIEVHETVSSFFSKVEPDIDNSNAVLKAIEILKNSLKNQIK